MVKLKWCDAIWLFPLTVTYLVSLEESIAVYELNSVSPATSRVDGGSPPALPYS
jgi:hypothetical protein